MSKDVKDIVTEVAAVASSVVEEAAKEVNEQTLVQNLSIEDMNEAEEVVIENVSN